MTPIMKKLFAIPLFLMVFASTLYAHQPAYNGPTTQDFGKVDMADLTMTSCGFEKDANAEILFDKGSVYVSDALVFERHIRIKIFNENAKDQANIRIEYFGGDHYEFLDGVQAETINADNGKIVITKVDKKQMFTQSIDRARTVLTFAFPDVKPGSILEYKYAINSPSYGDFPDWYFQNDIPTRYSEISNGVSSEIYYKNLVMVTLPYVKNTDVVKSMANIPSLPDEPFMNSAKDNAQRVLYELKSINMPGRSSGFSDTWDKVGEEVCEDDYFGGQFNKKLSGEDEIIKKAKSMTSQKERIAYVFDEVKGQMKWNDLNRWYTSDGTQDAWNKKSGNSTEINLIVCHLLQKSGVKAFPMMVSTRKNGKANPAYPSKYQFNKTVTYIPIDSTKFYVLDATNKYNVYNDMPADLLNTFGFWIDRENKKYDLVFLQKPSPVRQLVLVNAEIKPDGKIAGTVQINSFSYNRLHAVEKYKTDGEQKFMDYLQDGNNDLKISNVKFENMDVDTLPLTQSLDFNLNLSGSDENYIYVNTNLFTGMRNNPFLNENRFTDIDFKYQDNFSINGVYKIPAGYKTDALPKSTSMMMPDNSILFKRLVAEQDGSIVVRYVVDYRKSIFFKENYPELHEFYKKMLEMLNEQIVLKKG
jgi:hypothetical protein